MTKRIKCSKCKTPRYTDEYCVYCDGADDTLKFAWAYLILHGRETNGNWSYYGGCWDYKDNCYPSWEELQKAKEELRKKVVEIGIDFEKSGVPTVSHESGFLSTFDSHSSDHTATLGKLVLNNGETFLLGSDDEDAAHLAETARQMRTQKGESEVEKLAELL